MLILIGIRPAKFALDNTKDPEELNANLTRIENIISRIDSSHFSAPDRPIFAETRYEISSLRKQIDHPLKGHHLPEDERLKARRSLMLISRNLNSLLEEGYTNLPPKQIEALKAELSNTEGIRRYTDYAPDWVILMISLSLGLGTMVGWKRIVVTIGEKIGKQHLTYAQGASAEIVAAGTIAASSGLGLPVSTTHVLSSGIAGTMVANKGIKNLQADTVRNIMLAWILTLPVSMALSGTLYMFFRWIF